MWNGREVERCWLIDVECHCLRIGVRDQVLRVLVRDLGDLGDDVGRYRNCAFEAPDHVFGRNLVVVWVFGVV